MSRKLKILAALNVLGWIIVVPLLATALLDPFVNFGNWPGGFLTDRNGGSAQLADVGPDEDEHEGRDGDRRRDRGRDGGGPGAGAPGAAGDPLPDGGVTLPSGPGTPGGPPAGRGGPDRPGGNGGDGDGGDDGDGDGETPPGAVYSAPLLGEVGVTGDRGAPRGQLAPLRRRFPGRR